MTHMGTSSHAVQFTSPRTCLNTVLLRSNRQLHGPVSARRHEPSYEGEHERNQEVKCKAELGISVRMFFVLSQVIDPPPPPSSPSSPVTQRSMQAFLSRFSHHHPAHKDSLVKADAVILWIADSERSPPAEDGKIIEGDLWSTYTGRGIRTPLPQSHQRSEPDSAGDGGELSSLLRYSPPI